jgi:hypothetical protein
VRSSILPPKESLEEVQGSMAEFREILGDIERKLG